MKFLWLIPLVFLLVFLSGSGCATKEEKEAKHHERARALHRKGELRKAVIELKNVVQLNPKP